MENKEQDFINRYKNVQESDHLWFDLTKGFSSADLSPGDVVEFCARVSAYEKGYKGHKDDVLNRPIERDYRLSRPTKIKKIGKKLILKDEGGDNT